MFSGGIEKQHRAVMYFFYQKNKLKSEIFNDKKSS